MWIYWYKTIQYIWNVPHLLAWDSVHNFWQSARYVFGRIASYRIFSAQPVLVLGGYVRSNKKFVISFDLYSILVRSQGIDDHQSSHLQSATSDKEGRLIQELCVFLFWIFVGFYINQGPVGSSCEILSSQLTAAAVTPAVLTIGSDANI